MYKYRFYAKTRRLFAVMIMVALTISACHVRMEVECLWSEKSSAKKPSSQKPPVLDEKKTEPEKAPQATGGIDLSVVQPKPTQAPEPLRIRRTDKDYRPAKRKLGWVDHSETPKGQSSMGQCVASKPDGGCVEAGLFSKDIVFAQGSGSQTTLISQGGYDTYIVSYDEAGCLEWAKSVNSQSDTYPKKISVGEDGTVYLLGSYEHAVSLSKNAFDRISMEGSDKLLHAYVAAYSAEGKLLWANNVQHLAGGRITDITVCDTIAATPDNGCLIGGRFIHGIDISSQSGEGVSRVTKSIEDTAYFAKYDNEGNLLWTRFLEGSLDSAIHGLATLPNGDFYAIGGFIRDFKVETTGEAIKTVRSDSWGLSHLVLLCDSHGLAKEIDYQESISGYGFLNTLTPLENGDVVISGFYMGHHKLNTKPEPVVLSPRPGSKQACYMARMAPDGTILWYNVFETSSQKTIMRFATQWLGSDGNIYSLVRSDNDLTIKNGPEEIFVPQNKSRASVIVTSPEGDVLDCWQPVSDPGGKLNGLCPVADGEGLYLSGSFSKQVVVEDDYKSREIFTTVSVRERLLMRYNLK